MKSVLIVEDTPRLADWLREVVLQAYEGVSVEHTLTKSDALTAVGKTRFDLAMIDLGLPDGSGVEVIAHLREVQVDCIPVVITVFDDDEHLFPALQAGAFGYVLKDQERALLTGQLHRIAQGEPPLSPSIARRVLGYFAQAATRRASLSRSIEAAVALTDRETEVLGQVARGHTIAEIAGTLGISRFTVADYVKQIYRKLNVSSRAEAALEAVKRGLVDR